MKSTNNNYPLVSIVIPTLNSKEDIVKCLDSIQNLDYSKNKIELIIWDNGSTDGTQGEVSRIFEEMKKEGFFHLMGLRTLIQLLYFAFPQAI